MPDYNAYKYNENASLHQGTRWADEEEIKRACFRIRLSDPNAQIHGGLPIISNGDTVYLDNTDSHSLIIGSTGSKKTRLFAMPMLEIMRRSGESVLVTDPKGELYDLTSGLFRESGYRVNVINLRDPLSSNGWNPLSPARRFWKAGSPEKACGVVNDFVSAIINKKRRTQDPFWTNTSQAMLRGLIMAMVENEKLFPDEDVSLLTLRQLSNNAIRDEYGGTPPNSTFSIIETYPSDSIARYNLNIMLQGTERTYSNIRVSYESDIQTLFQQNALVSMLSCDEIDFSKLGTEKTILYLIMPDEKTTLHGIVSLIVKLCYEQLISTAQRCDGLTLPQRVNFLLDEFSNVPAIPDMNAMISAARSRNIKFFLIIQGFDQLRSKYGDDDARTIKGNCGNWAFLTSRELPLLTELSELCGQDDLTGEKLITVSQLQRLNKEQGEALIFLGRQYPYIARLADISKYVMPKSPTPVYPSLPTADIHHPTFEQIFERFSKDQDKERQAKNSELTDWLTDN